MQDDKDALFSTFHEVCDGKTPYLLYIKMHRHILIKLTCLKGATYMENSENMMKQICCCLREVGENTVVGKGGKGNKI